MSRHCILELFLDLTKTWLIFRSVAGYYLAGGASDVQHLKCLGVIFIESSTLLVPPENGWSQKQLKKACGNRFWKTYHFFELRCSVIFGKSKP